MWNSATKDAWWKLYRVVCFHMKAGYEGSKATPDASKAGSPNVGTPSSTDQLNGKRRVH